MAGATELDRFLSKVNKTNTCWYWTAYVRPDGYGAFRPTKGNMVNAHRYSYKTFVGELVSGMHIDHLCRNKTCVNPKHLQQVAPAENTRRGISGRLTKDRHKLVTHCPSGHEYTETNTIYSISSDGYKCRKCKTCTNSRNLKNYYKRKKEGWGD